MSLYCERCGNTDPRKFGYKNNAHYCRRCISFKSDKSIEYTPLERRKIQPNLKYNLSKEQQEISNHLLNEYKKGNNSLVHAVCGAGKTEIVLSVITHGINNGFRVGFAIPRKDVVIEISERFKDIFPSLYIISLYGGNTKVLEADLVVLTTHQLYRYKNYYDLLVVDEIDAFPFEGSDILLHQLKRSLKGNYIYMSATPSDEVLKEFDGKKDKKFELFKRFHNHDLPVPKAIKTIRGLDYIALIKLTLKFRKDEKPLFIFCPTIEMCEFVYKLLKLFNCSVDYVHSKHPKRKEVISNFKRGLFKILITTAVLERGVTFKNLQVIVFRANHALYNSSNLIQISGRVGRKIDAPDGEVIFICNEITDHIKKCIFEIKRANKPL